MAVEGTRTAGVPRSTMAALMLAVFVVSIGYGVALPLLPNLIERLLGGGAGAAQVSRHTGLLTAAYALALFLFAPLWGRLSDRHGPRGVLLAGLLGFGITMLVFSFVESIAAVYVEGFLSGMFAAAVTPVAAGMVGSFTSIGQVRARRLAFLSMASIAGFLLGPMLGVFVTPFPGSNLLTSLQRIVELGFLSAGDAREIGHIQAHNPLLFDFALKRLLRIDGHSIASGIFQSAALFRGPVDQAITRAPSRPGSRARGSRRA